MALPTTVKAEVKLTTGSGVQVSARELEALQVGDATAVGILAVLFWCGDREVDGTWVIVDAAEIRERDGESVSATKSALLRASRAQPWLDGLRQHVDRYWPPFLDAFKEEALRDHGSLVEELARCHREGLIQGRLPEHRILAAEHRATLAELIASQGEADAGRISQDLLAYLLAHAGYRKVTNNPVGVPDFVLSDLARDADAGSKIVFELTLEEAERLVSLCRSAGDDQLAQAMTPRRTRLIRE